MRGKILSEYRAPNILYYLKVKKYQELKYRLSSSELRIEFYLDLLFDFCKFRDRFLGKYPGTKCLVAVKVECFLFVMEMVFYIQFKDRTCYPQFKDTCGFLIFYYFDLKILSLIGFL